MPYLRRFRRTQRLSPNPFEHAYLNVLLVLTAVVAYPHLPRVGFAAPPQIPSFASDAALSPAAISSLPTVPQRQRVLGYERAAFGNGWGPAGGCDARGAAIQAQAISHPQMPAALGCGGIDKLHDPSSGQTLSLGAGARVEVDHVLPLAAAWDLGAHSWDTATRLRFANDPANLVVTSRELNQEKSDQLPAEWMPPHRSARCWYARRMAHVAESYRLALPVRDVNAMRRACWFSTLLAN